MNWKHITYRNITAMLLMFIFTLGWNNACISAKAEEAADPTTDGFPLKLQLIWGTDTTLKTNKFKAVSPETKKKFEEFLKWENYYEISCKRINLTDDAERSIQMSDKCKIKIRKIEEKTIEVKLYGEGKLIIKKRTKITAKKPQSIAGRNEANSDFWGIMISVDDGTDKDENNNCKKKTKRKKNRLSP